jgi:hypothetical protein
VPGLRRVCGNYAAQNPKRKVSRRFRRDEPRAPHCGVDFLMVRIEQHCHEIEMQVRAASAYVMTSAFPDPNDYFFDGGLRRR